ncbi:MAG: hypothetical protein OXR73_35075 [Myxococcales bacterium]|nr:hypothetical protein [Myxococcales bacterium]
MPCHDGGDVVGGDGDLGDLHGALASGAHADIDPKDSPEQPLPGMAPRLSSRRLWLWGRCWPVTIGQVEEVELLGVVSGPVTASGVTVSALALVISPSAL